MSVYITTIILVICLGYLEYRQIGTLGEKSNNNSHRNIAYAALILVFWFVGGFRYYVGSDFGTYYRMMPTSQSIQERFQTLDEPLTYLLTTLCRRIWNNGVFVIFVENAIITCLVFKGIKSYHVSNLTMPLLLYIFCCGWLFSFNGVRQAIAASIIFAFSAKKGRFWLLRYGIVVFVAFLFHQSALFVLPLLILANRKADMKQVLIMLVCGLLLPYVADFAMGMMGKTFSESNDYMVREINPLRIWVSFAPVALMALLAAMGQREFFRKHAFVTNMTFMNALITLVTANSAYLNRFSRYTAMYTMIFIPCFGESLVPRSRRIFYVVVSALYLIFFIYEARNNGNYLPFRWSFAYL